jgi:N-acetylmuramoyl-L-alanine amidase
MHDAGIAKIKDTILQGVFEDNLRMAHSHVKAGCSDQQSPQKTINRGLPILLITVLFVLFQFTSDPVSQQPEPAVALAEDNSTTVVSETVFPLPAVKIVSSLPEMEAAPVLKEEEVEPYTPEMELALLPPETEVAPLDLPGIEVPLTLKPQAEIALDQKAGNYVVIQPVSFTDSMIKPVIPFDAERLLKYNFLLNSEQVRLSSVFGLDVQTIVIDPGHGGKDPGAIGSAGTKEKEIVMDIALRLRDQLMQSGGYKVLLTRETDTFISLADRVKFSNTHKADLFISLHINALPQKQFNVTETFYFGPPSELYTLRLAEQENRGSEILSVDFKNMIQKIGDVLKEQESANLAATIQDSLFSNLQKYDREIVDNGTKIAPFVVLLGVDAPSVLVEISCISKEEEEANLNDTAYRERIITSLKAGITGYLSNRHTQVVKGDDNGKKIGNNS